MVQVLRYVRAIRKGWIKFDKPEEEPPFRLLWDDDSNLADSRRHGLSYIPAPKPKLPGTLFAVMFNFNLLIPVHYSTSLALYSVFRVFLRTFAYVRMCVCICFFIFSNVAP